MPAPTNKFKERLVDGGMIGLWLGLTSPLVAELCARRGFDWLVIDGEHAPNDLSTILAQLQAIGQTHAAPVVRVPIGEAWLIKQVLDLGAQTLLVPMIETAEQARDMVAAVRYPPQGIRGVGAALARASEFNGISDYLTSANEETCLLLQIESRRGLENLDAIATVEGVDGVFIGPADLAADMGHLGQPGAAEVKAAIETAIPQILDAGKAAGILTSDHEQAERYLKLGAQFVAVGSDVGLISGAAGSLRAKFRLMQSNRDNRT